MDDLMAISRLTGDEWSPAFSAMAPGPELAATLSSIDPALVANDNDVLELIAAFERQAAWTAAGQLAALAEFARRPWTVGLDEVAALSKRGAVGGSAATRWAPSCRRGWWSRTTR